LAFVFLFAAFAFKLSIVPFHLWTADVYEGFSHCRYFFSFCCFKRLHRLCFISALYNVFQPLQETWYTMLVILSIATMVIGNLFCIAPAEHQAFLAFSSIAQVGFILVGITSNDSAGITSVVYFILIYTFSNLAAFGVAAVIAEKAGWENIDDYKGLYRSNPFLTWILTLALFSLAGIPPTAGFFGKLFLLTAGASKGSYWFIIIAALNMVISLYYYLRVVRAMFMEKK
jgi:NADH-quinone oxidoreductase subunit N